MGAAPGSARSPASRQRGSAGPEGSGDITRGPLPPAGWVGPGAPRGRGVKEGEEEEQAWMCLCGDPGGAEAVERVAPGCPRQPCPGPTRGLSGARSAAHWDPRAERDPAGRGLEGAGKQSKASSTPKFFFPQLRPLQRRRRPAARRVPSVPWSGGN